MIGEIGAHLVADVEMLVRRQAEPLARRVGELGPTLAVALRGASDFRNALSNDGLGDDELRFAALGFFGLVEGLEDRVEVVAVGQRLHVPADGLETGGGAFALCLVRHGVERHIVGVVDENQIVESLVAGEGAGFHRHAFLHAAVACEADDMVVEYLVPGRVEMRRRHLAGQGQADRIANALAERTGGGLDPGGLVKFRMAGRFAVEYAEILQLLEGQIIAAQMQPAVEEHRAVAGGQHEAVAVEPAGLVGVVHQRMAVKHGADFRRPERQTEVAGGTFMNGIDGEAAGLGGGQGKNLSLKFHGRKRRKRECLVTPRFPCVQSPISA